MAREGLRFPSYEGLTKWLVTTKWGAEVMRDALYSLGGERFYQEFVERELCLQDPPPRPTYVLVVAHGDGFIEVFGERHVRAKVVWLPVARNVAQEMLLEQWVEVEVKQPYREVYFPSSKRTSENTIPLMDFRAFVELQQELEMERTMFNAVTKMGEQARKP